MLKRFFQNTRRPEGFGGRVMAALMNGGHASVADWGFTHISPAADADALDIGCGGGANLARLLAICPAGNITGVDYSPVSVEASAKKNKSAVDAGHCHIVQGDVSALPFKNSSFDLVTAFETIYFWPDLENAFRQVLRVLRPGGSFIICNELDGINASDGKWVRMIDGMTNYQKGQLIRLLKTAGFASATAYERPKKHWLCMTAVKAQPEETVK